MIFFIIVENKIKELHQLSVEESTTVDSSMYATYVVKDITWNIGNVDPENILTISTQLFDFGHTNILEIRDGPDLSNKLISDSVLSNDDGYFFSSSKDILIRYNSNKRNDRRGFDFTVKAGRH